VDLSLLIILIHDISSVVIRLASVALIPGWHKPSVAMAWLLVIFFWPIPGLILYLVFGSFKLPRQRAERHEKVLESLDRSCCAAWEAERPQEKDLPDDLLHLLRFASLAEKLGDMPPQGAMLSRYWIRPRKWQNSWLPTSMRQETT